MFIKIEKIESEFTLQLIQSSCLIEFQPLSKINDNIYKNNNGKK